jgi:hypothetical protein
MHDIHFIWLAVWSVNEWKALFVPHQPVEYAQCCNQLQLLQLSTIHICAVIMDSIEFDNMSDHEYISLSLHPNSLVDFANRTIVGRHCCCMN